MSAFWGSRCTVVPFTLGADAHRDRADMLNCSFHPDLWYDSSIDQTLSKILSQIRPEVMWIEYAYLSKAFELAPPEVVRVLDTIDRFAGRSERLLQSGVESMHLVPSFVGDSDELFALQRADCVVAIQENEAEVFSKLLDREVWTLGHRTTLNTLEQKEPARSTIAFLASESYVGAANFSYFQHSILPLLCTAMSELQVIVGGGVSKLLNNIPPEVKVMGAMESEADLFKDALLAINTDFCATGISIKNLTALGHAMPLVTTPNGARGIENGAGSAFLLADSDEDFVNKTIEILSSPERRSQLGAAAHRYIEKYNERQEKTMQSILQTTEKYLTDSASLR
ncbi:MAG: glycosyltransferase [Bdellovibrionota bacterium]